MYKRQGQRAHLLGNAGDHRDLHLSIRRQRQMCIRDSPGVKPKRDKHGKAVVVTQSDDEDTNSTAKATNSAADGAASGAADANNAASSAADGSGKALSAAERRRNAQRARQQAKNRKGKKKKKR